MCPVLLFDYTHTLSSSEFRKWDPRFTPQLSHSVCCGSTGTRHRTLWSPAREPLLTAWGTCRPELAYEGWREAESPQLGRWGRLLIRGLMESSCRTHSLIDTVWLMKTETTADWLRQGYASQTPGRIHVGNKAVSTRSTDQKNNTLTGCVHGRRKSGLPTYLWHWEPAHKSPSLGRVFFWLLVWFCKNSPPVGSLTQ